MTGSLTSSGTKRQHSSDFASTIKQLREQYAEHQQQETQRRRETLDKQVALEKELDEVKAGLRVIFDRHSSHNAQYGFLKLSQFKDILVQAKIFPERLNQEQTEVIYFQSKKRVDACLVYESFLKAVLSIAKFMFPSRNPVEATIKFYKKHLRNEIEQLRSLNHSGKANDLNKALWDKDVKLMRTLAPRFAKLYPLYWKNELVIHKVKSKFENEQESQKVLQRFVRDFNLVFLLQNAHIQAFNRLFEESLNQPADFFGVAVAVVEQGHSFKLSMLLHFLLKVAHAFYPVNGLAELLEKLEFSKGTEWARSEGLRISFINHYDVKL